MGAWQDSVFEHEMAKADDPEDVGWLISYWRIVPRWSKESHPELDYRFETSQFDTLIKAATRDEALEKFNRHVENSRASGKMDSIKGMTLFLSRVDTVTVISDLKGDIV